MKNYFLFLVISCFLVSCNHEQQAKDHLNLSDKLSGQWKAKAFDGELHEQWTLGDHGWMLQEGYYIAENDTSYSALTKIEKVGKDIILFSVIKDANPKIFKSIEATDNKIIFENKDYKNPFQVTYEFLDKQNYRRTIRGYEKDSLVVYEFNFKKRIP